jgi:hypothetical protein
MTEAHVAPSADGYTIGEGLSRTVSDLRVTLQEKPCCG